MTAVPARRRPPAAARSLPPRLRARDGGQATVEVALALPLVVLLALLVLQVGVVVRHQLAVHTAARNGARAAAASGTPAAAALRAAQATTPLRPLAVAATTASEAGGATTVTVTIRYTDPTDVPLVGWMVPAVPLRATVVMVVEPP